MLKSDQERFTATTVTLNNGNCVLLRFLALEDAEAFSDFYESIERAAYRFYCPHPLTRENARFRTLLTQSQAVVGLVAVDAMRQIVGYASFQWDTPENSPSVFGICLHKAYRGLGLGEALMARIAEIAQEIGPPIMSLTVQKANPRAVALYRRMGFKVVREGMRGQVEEFLPEPEYYMERVVR